MDSGRQGTTDSKTVVGVSSTKGSNPFLSATLLGNGLVNELCYPSLVALRLCHESPLVPQFYDLLME